MTTSRSSLEQHKAYQSVSDATVFQEKFSRWNVGRIRIFGIFVHFKYFALLMLEFSIVTIAIYYCYVQATVLQPQAETWLVVKSLFAAVPFSLCFAGLGLYSSRQTLSSIGILLRYLVASLIAITALWFCYHFIDAYVVTSDMVSPIVLSILFLAGIRIVSSYLPDSNLLKRRVLVIGAGEKASCIDRVAREPDQRGFSLLRVSPDLSIPGTLISVVKAYRINELVVAFDDRRNTLPAKELLNCRLSGVSVVDVLDFLERETGVIPFEHLQPSWLIFTDGFSSNVLTQTAKRAFDIVTSSLLLVITLPLILLCCLAIKLDRSSPGPIFYKQIRVGLYGENFHVLKFRSMRTDAEGDGKAQWAIQDDPRVSAVGSILRKYRLDEIPQLVNVLLGAMSLVGPRPERPMFVKLLNEKNDLYNERHRVKPGVTGWAQLRFPYTDNEDDSIIKLQYDMYYLKNQGFFFDIYILLQTIEVVLFGKGAR